MVDGKPPGDWRQAVVWCPRTSYDRIQWNSRGWVRVYQATGIAIVVKTQSGGVHGVAGVCPSHVHGQGGTAFLRQASHQYRAEVIHFGDTRHCGCCSAFLILPLFPFAAVADMVCCLLVLGIGPNQDCGPRATTESSADGRAFRFSSRQLC